MSIIVLCNGNVVIEYGRRKSGLPSAPLDRRYDSHDIER